MAIETARGAKTTARERIRRKRKLFLKRVRKKGPCFFTSGVEGVELVKLLMETLIKCGGW